MLTTQCNIHSTIPPKYNSNRAARPILQRSHFLKDPTTIEDTTDATDATTSAAAAAAAAIKMQTESEKTKYTRMKEQIDDNKRTMKAADDILEVNMSDIEEDPLKASYDEKVKTKTVKKNPVIDSGAAILAAIKELAAGIKESNEITAKIIKKNITSENTKNDDKVEKVVITVTEDERNTVNEQFENMKTKREDKLFKDANRLSHFSEQLSEKLKITNDAIKDQNKTDNENIQSNRCFLQKMNENINRLEVRTAKLEKQVAELNKEITNKDNLIKELKVNNDKTEDGQMIKKNEKTKQVYFLPTTQISPGPGPAADEGDKACVSWAAVVSKKYKPPIKLTREVVGDKPEYINDQNRDNTKLQDQLDDDNLSKAQASLEESQKKIGLKPITNEMIEAEAEKIENNPKTPKETTKNQIKTVAIKNLVMNFLKHCLSMSEKDRYQLKINTIYPPTEDDADIVYVQCDTKDDISNITKNARNLSKLQPKNEDDRPTLITHIPSTYFARYQECEKLLYTIRTNNRGIYQTNLRLGKNDLILRYKLKTDTTQWKNIPPISIPSDFPLPEVGLYKTKYMIPMDENPKIMEKIPKKAVIPDQDLLGSMIGQLREPTPNTPQNTNKRKSSPNNTEQNKQTKITPDMNSYNKWGILVDEDDHETINEIEKNTSLGKTTPSLQNTTNQTSSQNMSDNGF